MKDRLTTFELGAIEAARDGDNYPVLLANIRATFDVLTADHTAPIFTTDATGLFDLFLENLPEEARQHYNCRACRLFVDRFGGLVQIIPETGSQRPVMWDPTTAPAFFRQALNVLRRRVTIARVTGVFIPEGKRLGVPTTGDWHHMAVELPRERWHKDKLRTAHQVAAAKAEDHRLLCKAVSMYKPDTVKAALNLLRSGALHRGDRIKGPAEWFMGVLDSLPGHTTRYRTNLLWLATATAPAGFCHVSGTVLGTLLEDVAEGLDAETIKRHFASIMDPLKYQRPQAAPTAGNISEAEKVVEKLGVAASLQRRFARLDEIETIWTPTPPEAPAAGVFAHLLPKTQPARIVAKGPAMTWEKFSRTVLPDAQKIEFLTGRFGHCDYYSAIVTAVDPYAPPILQWDTDEKRNPFSWYVYNHGSAAESWNLPNRAWVNVTGITLQPNLWQPGFEYHGKAVLFILEGCRDVYYERGGLALFPETLKGELHGIRSTIEAYSRKGTLSGYQEASACGIRIQDGKAAEHVFRVTTALGVTEYTIDRWD